MIDLEANPVRAARLPDWQERLEAVIIQAQAEPFAWGQNDCCLFVGRAAEAITGRDYTSKFVGQYGDLASGLKRLWRAARVKSLADYADKLFLRTPVALAHRGDWALACLTTQPTGEIAPVMLLVDGPWLITSTGDRLPRGLAEICWRVA